MRRHKARGLTLGAAAAGTCLLVGFIIGPSEGTARLGAQVPPAQIASQGSSSTVEENPAAGAKPVSEIAAPARDHVPAKNAPAENALPANALPDHARSANAQARNSIRTPRAVYARHIDLTEKDRPGKGETIRTWFNAGDVEVERTFVLNVPYGSEITRVRAYSGEREVYAEVIAHEVCPVAKPDVVRVTVWPALAGEETLISVVYRQSGEGV